MFYFEQELDRKMNEKMRCMLNRLDEAFANLLERVAGLDLEHFDKIKVYFDEFERIKTEVSNNVEISEEHIQTLLTNAENLLNEKFDYIEEKFEEILENEKPTPDEEIIVSLAKSFNSRISANNKRISNLEQHINDNPFIIDDGIAYTKKAPANVLQYAEIQEIGGISSESKNMIAKPVEQTINGVSFTVCEDGGISANGTTTTFTYLVFRKLSVLKAGTYTFATNNSTLFSLFIVKNGSLKDGTFDGIEGNLLSTTAGVITFTLENDTPISIELAINPATNLENVVFYPMLNEGETALPFDVYESGIYPNKVSALEVKAGNLFTAKGGTYGGFSYSKNPDGSFTLNRTGTTNQVTTIGNFTATAGTTIRIEYETDIPDGFTLEYNFNVGTSNITIPPEGATLEVSENISCSVFLRTKNLPFTNNYLAIRIFEPEHPLYKMGSFTFEIPEAVQNLAGYGLGVDENLYNKLVFDSETQTVKFIKRLMLVNGKMETLPNPIEIDVSEHFQTDFFIPVMTNSPITAVNDYKKAVPTVIEYMLKGA